LKEEEAMNKRKQQKQITSDREKEDPTMKK